MVFTFMPSRGTITMPTMTATSELGTLAPNAPRRGHKNSTARHTAPTRSACQLKVPKFAASAETLSAVSTVAVPAGYVSPKKSFSWPMTMVTAIRGDGIRNKADDGAQLEQTHNHEQHAGNERRRDEAIDAVGRDNAGNDGRERRCRAGDLHTRTTEKRDEEACDDGRAQALLRADARSNRQRDRKRQRHDGDHDARYDVAGKLLFKLLFARVLNDAEQNRFNFVALQRFSIPLRRISIASRVPPKGKSCTAKIA